MITMVSLQQVNLQKISSFIRVHKRGIFISIFIFAFLLPFIIRYRLDDCRYDLLHAYIKNPQGEYIQKYNIDIPLKSYGELTKHCDGDLKSPCYNVYDKGETMQRQMHLSLLRMLHIIHVVCKKHNIKYWVNKGTLLGAHRNGLMVPWDDDADIGMRLQDFEKFDKIIRQELPNDISFQPHIEAEAHKKKRRFPWAKMHYENSCYTYCVRNGCNFKDGAQIDFFIFRFFDEGGNNPYLFDETQLVVDCEPLGHIPWSHIVPLRNITFEGIELNAPNNFVGTLAFIYGNFRRPWGECPNHYTPVPWASCQQIMEMEKNEREKFLEQLII